MTDEQRDASVAAARLNTVHFSDKAIKIMRAHSFVLHQPFDDGKFVCAIGSFVGGGDTLQTALDNAISLIDERNARYAKSIP